MCFSLEEEPLKKSNTRYAPRKWEEKNEEGSQEETALEEDSTELEDSQDMTAEGETTGSELETSAMAVTTEEEGEDDTSQDTVSPQVIWNMGKTLLFFTVFTEIKCR